MSLRAAFFSVTFSIRLLDIQSFLSTFSWSHYLRSDNDVCKGMWFDLINQLFTAQQILMNEYLCDK